MKTTMKNFFVLLLVLSFGKLAVAGVDISGEYRFREWSNFEVDSARSHDSRFMLGASFREGDSLMAHVSLIAGEEVVTNEVYGVWNFADAFELKFGTFSMDWANGSVFATNSWEPNPTTFDGVSLTYDAGMVKITYAELDRHSEEESDKVQAIAVDFMSLPAMAKTAHIFYIKKDTLAKYGAVLAGDLQIFNYELTYVADKDGDVSANMMNAEFGVDVLGMGKVVATYHKDDAEYAGFAYDMHANAGLMDVNAWGGDNGLTYYTVGYIHSVNDSSAAGVMYHDFKSTEGGEKLGTEIDVYASHKYNDVLTATARYGTYSPEGGDKHDQWMLGVNLNF